MVSFWQAFKNYWRRGFDFKGRSTRAEFWWMVLWAIIGLVILLGGLAGSMYILVHHAETNQFERLIYNNIIRFFVLTLVIGIILIIPSTALTVRRLRDTGLDTWFIWVLVIFNFILGRLGHNDMLWNNWWEILISILTLLVSLMMFIGLVMESNSLNFHGKNLKQPAVKVEILYPTQMKAKVLQPKQKD